MSTSGTRRAYEIARTASGLICPKAVCMSHSTGSNASRLRPVYCATISSNVLAGINYFPLTCSKNFAQLYDLDRPIPKVRSVRDGGWCFSQPGSGYPHDVPLLRRWLPDDPAHQE